MTENEAVKRVQEEDETLDPELDSEDSENPEPEEEDEGGEADQEDAEESEPEEEEGDAGAGDEEEFELVREGQTQPLSKQEKIDYALKKRLARERERREKDRKSRDDAEERAKAADEKARVLALALQQAQGKKAEVARPSVDDYAEGERDPGYIRDLDAYYDARADARFEAREAERQQQGQQSRRVQDDEKALETSLSGHLGRLEGLGAKDYEVKDDKAVEYLGDDIYNYIVKYSKKSHLLTYYLGTNKQEAEKLRSEIEANPPAGAVIIGELAATLKPKPKKRPSTPAPDPDEEIEGSGKGVRRKDQGPPGAKFF